MVHGIIIPSDNTAPLRTAMLDSLEDYQRAVGGWFEAVDIPDLGVTMYVNEDGLIRDLPFNRRATFLWRIHVPQARDARFALLLPSVAASCGQSQPSSRFRRISRRRARPGPQVGCAQG